MSDFTLSAEQIEEALSEVEAVLEEETYESEDTESRLRNRIAELEEEVRFRADPGSTAQAFRGEIDRLHEWLRNISNSVTDNANTLRRRAQRAADGAPAPQRGPGLWAARTDHCNNLLR